MDYKIKVRRQGPYYVATLCLRLGPDAMISVNARVSTAKVQQMLTTTYQGQGQAEVGGIFSSITDGIQRSAQRATPTRSSSSPFPGFSSALSRSTASSNMQRAAQAALAKNALKKNSADNIAKNAARMKALKSASAILSNHDFAKINRIVAQQITSAQRAILTTIRVINLHNIMASEKGTNRAKRAQAGLRQMAARARQDDARGQQIARSLTAGKRIALA